MRKSVFLRAWELVRTFSIDLSKALRTAWLEFKVETIANKINDLELKLNTADVREELKKLYAIVKPLNIALNQIKPVLSVEFNNSGARHDYGIGAYNGD